MKINCLCFLETKFCFYYEENNFAFQNICFLKTIYPLKKEMLNRARKIGRKFCFGKIWKKYF